MAREPTKQIKQCIDLLNDIFRQNLLGVYLYGSAVVGGLQKYSDLDIFVVTSRATTQAEKARLAEKLLQISGIYMQSAKLPIEMTVVEQAEINPWHYPPKFDFQYGDWLRKQFTGGVIEPWLTKEMPDLALLVTQVLLASKTLFGAKPAQLLCQVPYQDFMFALTDSVKNLTAELEHDTRNVLLTYARIWSTVATDTIRSKPAAVNWVIDRLPLEFHPVLIRAKLICLGEEKEYWEDLRTLITPCVNFIIQKINQQIAEIKRSNTFNRVITLAEEKK